MNARTFDVDDLRVTFPTRTGLVEAVRGVSFSLGRERLGIVGESGSGKSQTGRAIMGLTPPQAQVTAKQARLRRHRPARGVAPRPRALRGKRIAMILQDPKYSLDPVMSIGRQIVETLRTHEKVSKAEARERALAMLEAVQIRDPARVFDLHPHEVSGGMGQRAMIAMMLIAGPELLIADEPTSALDVTVQLDVLGILDGLVSERGMGLIFISHDLRLVSSFCDRVHRHVCRQGGRGAARRRELGRAQHPYTRGLLNCMPKIGADRHPLPVLDRKPEWAA